MIEEIRLEDLTNSKYRRGGSWLHENGLEHGHIGIEGIPLQRQGLGVNGIWGDVYVAQSILGQLKKCRVIQKTSITKSVRL